MPPSIHRPDDPVPAPAPKRPPVDVAAAQAKAAEVIGQFVQSMIEAGHPPEPGSPLWNFVKRAA